ncbi:uncharacterized protein LOC119368184 isoform X3 [Triticum dicoccoides]|uniref:uncharacterized protein LOC119368184 isoform X3 n=1 Tax=Triticum dicoccoides TaxID=85692 RepID=UPI00188EC125|nr:uncharacterized protein LOC119368184 isoform X3 [Triticum dicoccoides]XP_044325750.1 uncharacterized protein LOC123046444 isoform X2 [Triticum aestivum]
MRRRASRRRRRRWIRSAAVCFIPFFSSRTGASPWGAAGWGRKWSPGRWVAAAHALPPRAMVRRMDLGMLRRGGVPGFPRTSSPSCHRRRPRVLSRHASHLPAPCPTHLTPPLCWDDVLLCSASTNYMRLGCVIGPCLCASRKGQARESTAIPLDFTSFDFTKLCIIIFFCLVNSLLFCCQILCCWLIFEYRLDASLHVTPKRSHSRSGQTEVPGDWHA